VLDIVAALFLKLNNLFVSVWGLFEKNTFFLRNWFKALVLFSTQEAQASVALSKNGILKRYESVLLG
jgi:hypothetical protein